MGRAPVEAVRAPGAETSRALGAPRFATVRRPDGAGMPSPPNRSASFHRYLPGPGSHRSPTGAGSDRTHP